MNELIPINYEGEQPTVSARELHKGLEIKSNPNEHKKSLDSRSPAPLFLSTYITNEKYQNHNIYTEKIIICNNIEEKQLARKDLSGDDSVPVYSYGNMV